MSFSLAGSPSLSPPHSVPLHAIYRAPCGRSRHACSTSPGGWPEAHGMRYQSIGGSHPRAPKRADRSMIDHCPAHWNPMRVNFFIMVTRAPSSSIIVHVVLGYDTSLRATVLVLLRYRRLYHSSDDIPRMGGPAVVGPIRVLRDQWLRRGLRLPYVPVGLKCTLTRASGCSGRRKAPQQFS